MSVATRSPAQEPRATGDAISPRVQQDASREEVNPLNVDTRGASRLNSSLHDVEHKWKLKKDRKGIQVFLSNVPGSKHHAVLSVMRVASKPKSLAALVMDLENCSKWAAMCKKARVYERLSESESYVYSLNDAPFPVRDRDVLAKVSWSYDSLSGRISMISSAAVDRLPKVKGVIRVEKAVSEWHFTPQEDGTALVENYAHIDPNGAIPAWLTNIMIIDAPYRTMKKMRRIVESGKYDQAELAFITAD